VAPAAARIGSDSRLAARHGAGDGRGDEWQGGAQGGRSSVAASNAILSFEDSNLPLMRHHSGRCIAFRHVISRLRALHFGLALGAMPDRSFHRSHHS
jgi:hypothetical protein